METLRIELKNKSALAILKSLEKAKMIKLLRNETNVLDSVVQYKGAISKERAIELANEIEISRGEWDTRII
jgi:hypothetical protein